MRASTRGLVSPVVSFVAIAALSACAVQQEGSTEQRPENEGNVAAEAESLGSSATPGVGRWASRITMNGSILDVAADGSGGVVVLGSYGGHRTIDDTTGASNAAQTDNPDADWDFDTFVARFDSSGALTWVRTIPFTEHYAMQIAANPTGGIVLLAIHATDIGFPGCATLPSAGTSSWPFVARFDPNGNCAWIRDLPHDDGT